MPGFQMIDNVLWWVFGNTSEDTESSYNNFGHKSWLINVGCNAEQNCYYYQSVPELKFLFLFERLETATVMDTRSFRCTDVFCLKVHRQEILQRVDWSIRRILKFPELVPIATVDFNKLRAQCRCALSTLTKQKLLPKQGLIASLSQASWLPAVAAVAVRNSTFLETRSAQRDRKKPLDYYLTALELHKRQRQ